MSSRIFGGFVRRRCGLANHSVSVGILSRQLTFTASSRRHKSTEAHDVAPEANQDKGTPKKGARKRLSLAPISLTSKAADRIKDMIEGKDDVVGVHLSVKRRGCNGYSYIMNYANKADVAEGKDEIVENHGVTVLVDPKAIFFVVGTTMDYNETDLAAEFTFMNPNIKGECGCGESFNI